MCTLGWPWASSSRPPGATFGRASVVAATSLTHPLIMHMKTRTASEDAVIIMQRGGEREDTGRDRYTCGPIGDCGPPRSHDISAHAAADATPSISISGSAYTQSCQLRHQDNNCGNESQLVRSLAYV